MRAARCGRAHTDALGVARRTGATEASDCAGWPTGKPARIGPRTGAGDRRTPKRGGFRTLIPSRVERQGRPLGLRITDGPRPDRPRALMEAGTTAARAYDVDALRAWRTRQGMEAVLPTRARRMNLPAPRPGTIPGAPRDFDGLPRGRRVTTRDDPYAQRRLAIKQTTAVMTKGRLRRPPQPGCADSWQGERTRAHFKGDAGSM